MLVGNILLLLLLLAHYYCRDGFLRLTFLFPRIFLYEGEGGRGLNTIISVRR